MSKLRSVAEIDLPYSEVFNSFNKFNWIQSAVYDDIFKTTKSMVISAPTGAGKTVICELAIINLLKQFKNTGNDPKIIYVAPVKALCSEKFYEWNKKFQQLNLKCLELTGDSDIIDFNDVLSANIIVTTPEKWDSITRRWRDYQEFVKKIRLFLIDEVHLLNEDIRGPILETIVSRMKTVNSPLKPIGNNEFEKGSSLRFIAVSATIPNIEDIRTWLGGYADCIQHKFSDDQRPVKLDKVVLGYPTNLPSFRFDIHLNYRLSEVIRQYSNQKPTLIFCSSRKSVEMAAAVLQNQYSFKLSESQMFSLIALSSKLQNTKLIKLVGQGIAFHHAGLTYPDRNQIEEAFRCGLIMVLISTNTLALGVNLPAHLVIIKSTETFIRGAIIEYTETQILQMIGRAGRPQYDTTGIAVVMTQTKNVKKYENLMNGCTPVESHLHKHLAEHLNSEIVLQTITDLEIAMEWIRSTFLYVRAVRCPINYGFAKFMTRDKVEKKLEEICLSQINSLEEYGLVVKDQTSQVKVYATPFGRLMSRYYISFDTMKMFRKIRGNESFLEIFNTITRCKEFSEFTLRVNEKKALNEINNFPVRFPIQGKIKTRENKTSCLIQAIFGNLHIADSYFVQESLKMLRLGERISKCFSEYIRLLQTKENSVGLFKAQLNAVIIAKCFRSKLWEQSIYISKQLKKIGEAYSNLLVNAGKTTIQSILDTSPRILERILNKQPPFGDEIIESLRLFPAYKIEMDLIDENSVQIFIYQINSNHVYNGNNSIIVVGDDENNLLLYYDKVDLTIQQTGVFTRTFSICGKNINSIHAHLVHEALVGVDKTRSLVLNPVEEIHVEKNSKKPQKKKQPKISNSSTNGKNSENNTKEGQDNIMKNIEICNSEENVDKDFRSKLRNFTLCKKKVDHTLKEVEVEKNLTDKSHNNFQLMTSSNTLDASNTITLDTTEEKLAEFADNHITTSENSQTDLLFNQTVDKNLINEIIEDPCLFETEKFVEDAICNDHDSSIVNVHEISNETFHESSLTKEHEKEPTILVENPKSCGKIKVYKQRRLSQFYNITKKPSKLIGKNYKSQSFNSNIESVKTAKVISTVEALEKNQCVDVPTEKCPIPETNLEKCTKVLKPSNNKSSSFYCKQSETLIMSAVKNVKNILTPSTNSTNTTFALNSATKRLPVASMPGSLLLRKSDATTTMMEQNSEVVIVQDTTLNLTTVKDQPNAVDLSKNQSVTNQPSPSFIIDDTNVNWKALEANQKTSKHNILKENLFKSRNRNLTRTICESSQLDLSNQPLNLKKSIGRILEYTNNSDTINIQPENIKSISALNLCKKDSKDKEKDKITSGAIPIPKDIDQPSDIVNLHIKFLIEMSNSNKNSTEVDDKVSKILKILHGPQNDSSAIRESLPQESKKNAKKTHLNQYLSSTLTPICLNDTTSEGLDLSTSENISLKRQLKLLEPSPKRARLNVTTENSSYRLRLSPDSNKSLAYSKVSNKIHQINSQLMAEIMQSKCNEFKDTIFFDDYKIEIHSNASSFFDKLSNINTLNSFSSNVLKSESSNEISKWSCFNIKPDSNFEENNSFFNEGNTTANEAPVKEEFSNIFSQNLNNLNDIFGISSTY